jgi:hypothetical protein
VADFLSSLQSTALLIPGGAVTCVTIYFFTYFADKYKNIRTLVRLVLQKGQHLVLTTL